MKDIWVGKPYIETPSCHLDKTRSVIGFIPEKGLVLEEELVVHKISSVWFYTTRDLAYIRLCTGSMQFVIDFGLLSTTIFVFVATALSICILYIAYQ